MTDRWPETLQPADCSFGRQRNDGILESPTSRKRQIVRRGRPLWTSKTTWKVPPHRVAEMRYQLERLDGGRETVRLRDYADPRYPGPYAPNGASELAGTEEQVFTIDFTDSSFVASTGHYGAAYIRTVGNDITAQASAAIGATSVSTAGWTASLTGIVKAGQYVEISERLYIVAADANSSSAGLVTLTLTTPLIDPVAVGDRIEVTIPRARMRPASPDWSGSRSATEGLWTVDVEFVESVA